MAFKRKPADDRFGFDEAIRQLAESTKVQADRPNIHGYVPHDKQVLFHSAARRHRLYIGGNRSGKTTGGIIEDIWWLTGRHPYRKVPQGGVRGRIVGVDFTDGIEKILRPEMMRWCPVADLRGGSWDTAYDTQERTLHFENKSFVEFMSYEQAVAKFAGTSRHFVHFDEEPPQDIFIECLARLIDTKGSYWMTLTPVMGMEWMFDEIYNKGMTDPESNISVIEVDMTENPHLDPNEIKDFLENIPEEDRGARVHGEFIRRGGVIYKAFTPKIHVIDNLEEIPSSWEIWASVDHGFNNPTAWLWHALSPDGDIITFAEHYEREMIVEDHAAQVHLINQSIGRVPTMYVGDPAIAQRSPITGDSVAMEYAKYGINIAFANNEVMNGINKVNTYLKYTDDRKPRWHITRGCENLIKELAKYRWKTWSNKKSERANNLYDVPHKKDDHACDSLRYFFTFMPDLTPFKSTPVADPKLPVLGKDGADPRVPRFDTNLRKPKTDGDWVISGMDEYMGAEW